MSCALMRFRMARSAPGFIEPGNRAVVTPAASRNAGTTSFDVVHCASDLSICVGVQIYEPRNHELVREIRTECPGRRLLPIPAPPK